MSKNPEKLLPVRQNLCILCMERFPVRLRRGALLPLALVSLDSPQMSCSSVSTPGVLGLPHVRGTLPLSGRKQP